MLLDFPRKDGYCHMVSDSISELHEFAKSIGVKKCWYENKRGKKEPHYDIKGIQIKKAIDAGGYSSSKKRIEDILKKTL